MQIAKDITSYHEKAASALRPPRGYSGAYGSFYVSAANLMKQWAKQHNRREIVMITHGIDPDEMDTTSLRLESRKSGAIKSASPVYVGSGFRPELVEQ